MFESEYAYWPYVVAEVTTMGGSLIFILVGGGLFLHAFLKARLALCHLRVLAVLLFGIASLVTLGLATSQGMDVMPTAVSVIIAAILWALLLPLVFLLSGGDAQAVLWIRSDAHLHHHESGSSYQQVGAGSGSGGENSDPSSSFSSSKRTRGASQVRQENVLNPYNSCNVDFNDGTGAAAPQQQQPTQEMKTVQNFGNNINNNNSNNSLFLGSASGIEGLRGPGAKRDSNPETNSSTSNSKNNNNDNVTTDFQAKSQEAIMKAKQELQEKEKRKGNTNKDSDLDELEINNHNHNSNSNNNTKTIGRLSRANSDFDLDLIGDNVKKPNTSRNGNNNNNHNNDVDSVCTEPGNPIRQPEPTTLSRNLLQLEQRAELSTSALPMEENYKSSSITIGEENSCKNNNNNTNLCSSSTTSSSTLPRCERMKIYSGNLLSLVVRDIKRRPVIFSLFVFFAFNAILWCNLLLFGICVMNKPQSITTWFTRRLSSKTNYCPAGTGKPCFTYPLVGDTCSSIVIASHFVVGSDAQIPDKVEAEICRKFDFDVTTQKCSTSLPRSTVIGFVRNNDNLAEDRRYVGNIYVNGLVCGEEYSATVTFSNNNGQNTFVADEICFKALPGDVGGMSASGTSDQKEKNIITNQVEELSFIEGGDYVVQGRSSTPSVGKALLAQAIKELGQNANPNTNQYPSFFSLLGDIAYDNNMRRCYRRVDEFLHEVLDALRIYSSTGAGAGATSDRSKMCLIPLQTGVGNHCTGGYLWHGDLRTTAARLSVSAFYYQYYPFLSFEDSSSSSSSSPVTATQPQNNTRGNFTSIVAASTTNMGDISSTFRIHLIGSNTSYIVVDSGHWSPLDLQAQRLRSALLQVRAMRRTAVVSYHVPIYPSTRDKDSTNPLTEDPNRVEQTFLAFSPVLKDFDDVVTVALEHHDHNYKRTERIDPVSGAVVVASPSASVMVMSRARGRGIVFSGDGALGASVEDPIALSTPPLKVGFSGNYVSTIRMFSNGSLHVKAIGPEGSLIDQFLLI